jgi:hypothetical protein
VDPSAVLAALEDAGGYKRDRVATCGDFEAGPAGCAPPVSTVWSAPRSMTRWPASSETAGCEDSLGQLKHQRRRARACALARCWIGV